MTTGEAAVTRGSAAPADGVRLDKWLWAARFFKTRSLAQAAVTGGKVHLDGERVKPSRRIRVGSVLRIRRGVSEWEVNVRALSERRGPATAAAALYDETQASAEKRASDAERERQKAARRHRGLGRPSKKERREMEKLRTGAADPS